MVARHGKENAPLNVASMMMTTVQDLTLPLTVLEMYRLAIKYREDVRSLRLNSLSDVFNLVKSVRYVRDVLAPECHGSDECVKRPSLTMVLGGDCDDKAILAGAALSSIGIPWRIVTVSYDGSGEMVHTYLEVYHSGAWRPFDATTGSLALFQERPFTKKIVW